MGRPALALLVALIGFGAGYFVRVATEPAPPLDPGDATPIKERPDPAAAADAETPGLVGSPPARPDNLSAVVASFKAPIPERGSGTIHGAVRRNDQEGLAGVRITATPRFAPDEAPEPSDPEARLVAAVRARIEGGAVATGP